MHFVNTMRLLRVREPGTICCCSASSAAGNISCMRQSTVVARCVRLSDKSTAARAQHNRKSDYRRSNNTASSISRCVLTDDHVQLAGMCPACHVRRSNLLVATYSITLQSSDIHFRNSKCNIHAVSRLWAIFSFIQQYPAGRRTMYSNNTNVVV